MEFGPDQMTALGGLATTMLGGLWGVLHFALGRIDRQAAKTSADVAALHKRIDETRDQHVRREDYHRDLEALRSEVRAIREEVTSELRTIGSRIDQVLLALRVAAE